MGIRLKLIASALSAGLLVTIVFASPKQEAPSQKKAYVHTGKEASIAGTVTLLGELPKALTIDLAADPSCYTDNPHPKTEWYRGRAGGLANVLVYVASDSLDNFLFSTPTSPVVLEHKRCRYEPHVMGLQVGQPLNIVNSDETIHNTHPTPRVNQEWNQTQAMGAPPLVKTFGRAEVSIPFKCNQHPWERAYVSVFAHPFFAVTDMEGNFRIEGLPPGSYKVTAWHERLSEKNLDAVLAPGESRYLSFAFSAPKAKP